MKPWRVSWAALLTVVLLVVAGWLFWSGRPDRFAPAIALGYPAPAAPLAPVSAYPGPQPVATRSSDCAGKRGTTRSCPATLTPVALGTVVPALVGGWPTPTPHSFPTPNTFRQGVAAAGGNDTLPERHLLGSWGYYWGPSVPIPYPAAVDHVPMIAPKAQATLPSLAAVQLSDQQTPHDYWLVFNECEHYRQCATPPTLAAATFNSVVDLLFQQGGDPNAQLIVGGVNAHPCGIRWLEAFIEAVPPVNRQYIAGWHFHLYPEVYPPDWTYENGQCLESSPGVYVWDAYDYSDGTSHAWRLAEFNEWKRDAMNALHFVQKHGKPSDEIWFNEIGCLPNRFLHADYEDYCENPSFMASYVANITGWLNSEGRWVTRYAWFADWDRNFPEWYYTMLYSVPPPAPNASLSALGVYYSQVEPAAATDLPWPVIWLPLIAR